MYNIENTKKEKIYGEKIMKIYLARHGQTQWNVENKISGTTDVPLTEIGREQARQLAEKAKDYPIDVIIASPLNRAKDTAQYVADVKGLKVHIDERLKEQNFGIMEGTDRKSEEFIKHKKELAVRFPQGESSVQVMHRVYSLIDEIRVKYADKNVLLVCHGGICRAARTYFMDLTAQEYSDYSPENASITEYEI